MRLLRCPRCGDWPALALYTEREASALVALHISVAHVTAAGLVALLPPEETRTSE